MTFFLSPVFCKRTTPGAWTCNCNPQKREEPRWKPVQDPSAEKWDHGWNVSTERKRFAAVSEPVTVNQNIFISVCRTQNVCCYFNIEHHRNEYIWNGKYVSDSSNTVIWIKVFLWLHRRLTKEELERRSKENMLSEVGGKALEAEEQVKVLRQRINEMEEQMKKTEEVYKEQVGSCWA